MASQFERELWAAGFHLEEIPAPEPEDPTRYDTQLERLDTAVRAIWRLSVKRRDLADRFNLTVFEGMPEGRPARERDLFTLLREHPGALQAALELSRLYLEACADDRDAILTLEAYLATYLSA